MRPSHDEGFDDLRLRFVFLPQVLLFRSLAALFQMKVDQVQVLHCLKDYD